MDFRALTIQKLLQKKLKFNFLVSLFTPKMFAFYQTCQDVNYFLPAEEMFQRLDVLIKKLGFFR